jgi:hypothetical protein
MTHVLSPLLRFAGAGLILLALTHIPMSKRLRWREEAARMSLSSASVFHVHTLFVCAVLVLMGLPALLAPDIFLDPTRAGRWIAWSYAAFFALRLFAQWFVFPRALWRGKPFETQMHLVFTMIWLGLVVLFVACGMMQLGRMPW